MGLDKNNRASISFSEIGDADLIAILQEVNYNFAGYCKELMRDGLKYRGLAPKQNKVILPKPMVKLSESVVKKLEPSIINQEELIRHVASKFDKL
jgi:hypothetical protein